MNYLGKEPSVVKIYLRMGPDHHQYNAPHHEEVAIMFTGENGESPNHRDIIIYPRDQPLR